MVCKMMIAFAAVAMVSAASMVSPSVAAVRSASGPPRAVASHTRPPAHSHAAISGLYAGSEAFHIYHAAHCEQEKRRLEARLAHLELGLKEKEKHRRHERH